MTDILCEETQQKKTDRKMSDEVCAEIECTPCRDLEVSIL